MIHAPYTPARLAEVIGQRGDWRPRTGQGDTRRDVAVRVHVLDVRVRCGSVDLLVTPLSGSGKTWITQEQIYLGDEVPA